MEWGHVLVIAKLESTNGPEEADGVRSKRDYAWIRDSLEVVDHEGSKVRCWHVVQ